MGSHQLFMISSPCIKETPATHHPQPRARCLTTPVSHILASLPVPIQSLPTQWRVALLSYYQDLCSCAREVVKLIQKQYRNGELGLYLQRKGGTSHHSSDSKNIVGVLTH